VEQHARVPGKERVGASGRIQQEDARGNIDEEAAAHVDAVSYCLFTAFWSSLPDSALTDLFPWRPPGMDDAGMDPLKVLMDRCRHHKMKFIADIRMNDRHGVAPNGIMKQHPEWALFDGAWDYAFDPVRQAMLDFTREVLDTYDVDGIEYDYMRWCHMFQRGEGAQNAHVLTEFMRKSRKLLDEAAKRRGCDRLLFGVRVPQSIAECDYLGFDIATWIKEGLVDYVVPSDFFHTDTNMKTEVFVKLTEGTDCKVYPAIHNQISMDAPNEHYKLMTPANFRAAAQNFYAYGADGISPYNYQRAWGRRFAAEVRASSYACYMWPAALGWFRELRYPDQIGQQDRHYLFYAVFKEPRKSPSGFSNDDNIYLHPGQGVLEGSRRFRMAEDMSDPRLRVTMQFKVLGLTDPGGHRNIRSAGDRLEIRINDAVVPPEYVTIVFDKNLNELKSTERGLGSVGSFSAGRHGHEAQGHQEAGAGLGHNGIRTAVHGEVEQCIVEIVVTDGVPAQVFISDDIKIQPFIMDRDVVTPESRIGFGIQRRRREKSIEC
jgi:hypothetical protein